VRDPRCGSSGSSGSSGSIGSGGGGGRQQQQQQAAEEIVGSNGISNNGKKTEKNQRGMCGSLILKSCSNAEFFDEGQMKRKQKKVQHADTQTDRSEY